MTRRGAIGPDEDPEGLGTTLRKRADAFFYLGVVPYGMNQYRDPREEDLETIIKDFLSDARHFCDQHGIEWEDVLHRTDVNHAAEINGEI